VFLLKIRLCHILQKDYLISLKRELVELANFTDQQQAAAEIFEYIEVFYNKIRYSSIGYLASVEFEESNLLLQKIIF